MNQEELKQRLIELLNYIPCRADSCPALDGDSCPELCSDRCGILDYLDRCQIEIISDRLIANGVTIRERGEWRINCDGYYPYCPNCNEEPKNGIMTNFCPHCGADMRGWKDEYAD